MNIFIKSCPLYKSVGVNVSDLLHLWSSHHAPGPNDHCTGETSSTRLLAGSGTNMINCSISANNECEGRASSVLTSCAWRHQDGCSSDCYLKTTVDKPLSPLVLRPSTSSAGRVSRHTSPLWIPSLNLRQYILRNE